MCPAHDHTAYLSKNRCLCSHGVAGARAVGLEAVGAQRGMSGPGKESLGGWVLKDE